MLVLKPDVLISTNNNKEQEHQKPKQNKKHEAYLTIYN